jgi:hypothetical protein
MMAVGALFATVLSVPADEPAQDFELLVRKFSQARHIQANNLSRQLDIPLPRAADMFFNAAVMKDWEVISNSFSRLTKGAIYGPAAPELQNELWAPIHETLGLWAVWVGWKRDSTLLSMFYTPVLTYMPQRSIYFGGTDYGRFVITAVNDLRDPPPAICITQNALAESSYMAHLRAVHGERMWLPSIKECSDAFQEYIADVQRGIRQAGDVEVVDGHVVVRGVKAVMDVNSILARMIFEQNKDNYAFFVEESFVMDWMYSRLTPYTLIMKLNADPLDALPEDAVARDRKLWASYAQRLLEHPGFADNDESRRAFAKLRTAVAGLYAYLSLIHT